MVGGWIDPWIFVLEEPMFDAMFWNTERRKMVWVVRLFAYLFMDISWSWIACICAHLSIGHVGGVYYLRWETIGYLDELMMVCIG